MKRFATLSLFMGLLLQALTSAALSPAEIKEIAKEAYIYGYPIVENYRVMYHSTQDKNYPQYAPFNTFYNARNLTTPKDTLFVSPNVDTPYSYAVLYLKDEPVVISIPAFEKNRFIGVPIYDLYTHVVYTISPKNMSHAGGKFLVANTQWKGQVPKGITQVIRCETNLAYVLIRTQLFNAQDLKNVHKLQSAYKIQGLAEYSGKKALKSTPASMLPPLDAENPKSKPDAGFFNVLNFALGFAIPHSSETALMQRFAKIGIAPGKKFVIKDAAFKAALEEGIAQAQKEMVQFLPKIKSSSEIFGSRESLGNNYMGRAVGAWTGIYANSAEVFLGIAGVERQADGKPFSGANNYTITFGKDDFPPVDAFWSITLYKLPSRLLYSNPIERYSISSPMEKDLVRNPDGSVTIYIQHESPGKKLENNWLPCPKGYFTMAFRCYLPQEKLRKGLWSSPPVILHTK